MSKRSLIGIALSVSAMATVASYAERARAHIDMEGELKGRGGDQKVGPCEGAPRRAEPYQFEPGATITLGVLEGIPHDGYFRIAFDDDGEDFVDPTSIAPINPNRYGRDKKCLGTPDDHCGESDFCNMVSDGHGPTVLWDHLDPHLGADVTFGQTRFWTVELPDVECDNCTLQVMQVMEDPAGGAHGPFDGENDLYYRCVDIVLKRGVGETPGTSSEPAENDGVQCAKSRTPRGGDADGDDDDDGGDDDDDGGVDDDEMTPTPAPSEGDGCALGRSGDADAPATALLALLALGAMVRRRRA